jgi:hypothetical protein
MLRTVRYIRTVVVSSVILASAACGGDGGANPSNIGESIPALGTLRATVDGATKEFVVTAATDSLTNLVVIGGEDSPLTTFVALQTQAAVGTKSVPDTDVVAAYAGSETWESGGWAAYGPNGSGTITIKSINSTSITGTFSFTMVAFGTASGTKVIANGSFNAPLFSN